MSRIKQTNGNENEILSVMIEGKIDEIRVVGFSSKKKKKKRLKKEHIMLKTRDKMRDIAKRGMGNVKSGIKRVHKNILKRENKTWVTKL